MRRIKLLIACGGTGGHVFPAVALADCLRQRCPQIDILFAGMFSSHIQQMLRSNGYGIVFVAGRGMPRRFNLLIVPFFINLLSSLTKAFCILKEYRPDIVVSMGSFSGGPFVLAAKLFRLPALIHEQNLMPGRSNRISAYFADRVAVGFRGSVSFFPQALRQKIVYTGNPLRREILGLPKGEALKQFGFEKEKFTILAMGGSQGAHKINSVVVESAKGLDKGAFQILHLAGKFDFDFVTKEYEKAGIKNKVFSFLEKIGLAYAVSDLVVCRSGAVTITEIASLGLASVLIPYPYGDAHQAQNADILKKAGAAVVIEEKDLTPEKLLGVIKNLSGDNATLGRMRENSRRLTEPGAAENLAKEVLGLLKL